MRAAFERLKAFVPSGVPAVSVAKGIEIATLKRPSEIILEVLGERPVAALSGPSIAGELARKLPATMVVAAEKTQSFYKPVRRDRRILSLGCRSYSTRRTSASIATMISWAWNWPGP